MKVIEITDDQLVQMEALAHLNNDLFITDITQKLQIQVIGGLTIILLVLLIICGYAWWWNRDIISSYYDFKQSKFNSCPSSSSSSSSSTSTSSSVYSAPLFTPQTKQIDLKTRRY
ncbi:hypothetical protein CYY_010489 [Polysphondylium violaceum]|uniref:Uncharacterized protein n=1 Tax=Polysphondylium violaceum TaxID=133409 RepID=A0A8J4PJS2_9MYCE|nr:hypothetical protein CYY_010489 [Polysphondylium violaceum]